MTVSQLQTFIAVCRGMSFTDAARSLYISQPAVSRQMSALESELGVVLFERAHSTIQLTPAGTHLYQNLVPVMDRMDALLSRVREIGSGTTGTLTIGLLLDQGLDPLVSETLQRLRTSHNITVTIQRLDGIRLFDALNAGEIDLAISILQVPGMLADFERLVYAREKMCFAGRRDIFARLGGRPDRDAVQRYIENYPLLAQRPEEFPREYQTGPGRIHGEDPSLVENHIYYDQQSIAPMVSAGIACTFVNESHALAVDRNILLVPMNEMEQVDKAVLWLKENRNPVLAQFCSILQELAKGGTRRYEDIPEERLL